MFKSIYENIIELFNEKQNFILATILDKSGSVPREEGTKMIIKKDLSIIGTIGGGILEASVIKTARDIFLSKNKSYSGSCLVKSSSSMLRLTTLEGDLTPTKVTSKARQLPLIEDERPEAFQNVVKKFNLSNKDASLEGMVCGGELRVFIEYIDIADESLKNIYEIALNFSKARDNFAIITQIDENDNLYKSKKWLCTETNFYGTENKEVYAIYKKISEDFKCLKVEVLTTIRKVIPQSSIGGGNCVNKQTFVGVKSPSEVVNNSIVDDALIVNDVKYLVEPFLNYETVFIIGAGHVGQKLANITKMLNFRTVVIDDRNEFANKNRFPEVDEIIVLNSFDNILNRIKVDNQSYVVIVTRGHIYDKDVLGQVLKTKAKYIGMIGSKKKKEFIYNSLLNEGYTNEDLSRVYSPIGLSIFAETPEEIAVSIAGELIKIRRENKNFKIM